MDEGDWERMYGKTPTVYEESKMTTRAQNLSQAIKEVGWDWETMERAHPHTIAVATLRAVADRFATDWGELQHPCDILNEIADELEAL